MDSIVRAYLTYRYFLPKEDGGIRFFPYVKDIYSSRYLYAQGNCSKDKESEAITKVFEAY